MESDSMTVRPLRVRAQFDEPRRWMWIVKPILAIPHFVALAFLNIAMVLLTVVAFFAILFTGRYPGGIFSFNAGVLRWGWRVRYYTFPLNATDKYPPFSLDARPDYPADLEIDHPEHLTNWAVLVKWWLLALPHYLILRALRSAGMAATLVAAVGLLFTGTYPQGLFDLLLAITRWEYRVTSYALLMHDQYPPFRLDQTPDPTAPIPADPNLHLEPNTDLEPPTASQPTEPEATEPEPTDAEPTPATDTKPAATEEPEPAAAETPADEATTNQPATPEAATAETPTTESATEEAATVDAATEGSAASDAAAAEPATAEPATEESAAEESAAEESAAEESAAGDGATEGAAATEGVAGDAGEERPEGGATGPAGSGDVATDKNG